MMSLDLGPDEPAIVTRGEDHYLAKLTDEKVRDIRELHAWKQREIKRLHAAYSAKALARRYGVSTTCIENALAGKTWAHVK